MITITHKDKCVEKGKRMSKLPLEYNMVYRGCEHFSHKKEGVEAEARGLQSWWYITEEGAKNVVKVEDGKFGSLW